MSKAISLREIISALEAASDDCSSYLDPETGEIIVVTEEERALAEDKCWEEAPIDSFPRLYSPGEGDQVRQANNGEQAIQPFPFIAGNSLVFVRTGRCLIELQSLKALQERRSLIVGFPSGFHDIREISPMRTSCTGLILEWELYNGCRLPEPLAPNTVRRRRQILADLPDRHASIPDANGRQDKSRCGSVVHQSSGRGA